MNLKCIGCFQLRRIQQGMTSRRGTGSVLVAYDCIQGRYPYRVTIGGLLRPTNTIIDLVKECPEDPLRHCVVCAKTKIIHYGEDIVSICSEHDKAWGEWLEQHPERQSYMHPKGRNRHANWVEVFREFVEDVRRQRDRKELPDVKLE